MIGCYYNSVVKITKQPKNIHLVNFPNADLRRDIERVKQKLHTDFGITINWNYMDVHKEDGLKWNSLSKKEDPNCSYESKEKR